MNTCYFCGTAVEDDYYCFGCEEAICDDCNLNESCWGHHAPDCHTDVPDPELDEDFD